MRIPATKVVEHPDIFVAQSEYTLDDFDYIIELRNDDDEEITYHLVDDIELNTRNNFSMFDF
jgi:hypothetical protein